MSTASNLGAFNKDKVANKFGIQLKRRNTTQEPTSPLIERKTTTAEVSNATKNKTVSNFRIDNSANGYLSNKSTTTSSNTSELRRKTTEKTTNNKSTSWKLVNTSTENEENKSLASNIKHSARKSLDPVVSPIPSVKQSNVSKDSLKTQAQIEQQKDQPLYKRQSSKPLNNNTSLTINKNTTTSISSLKQ